MSSSENSLVYTNCSTALNLNFSIFKIELVLAFLGNLRRIHKENIFEIHPITIGYPFQQHQKEEEVQVTQRSTWKTSPKCQLGILSIDICSAPYMYKGQCWTNEVWTELEVLHLPRSLTQGGEIATRMWLSSKTAGPKNIKRRWENNILRARVDQLLNLGMQDTQNWDKRASLDKEGVLVKTSVSKQEHLPWRHPLRRGNREAQENSSLSIKDNQFWCLWNSCHQRYTVDVTYVNLVSL